MGKRVRELAVTETLQDTDVLLIDNDDYISSKKITAAKLLNLIKSKVPNTHNTLSNRDLANQHPIGAITNLRESLDSLQNDKVAIKEYRISSFEVMQSDATAILQNYFTYTNSIIKFVNSGSENKIFAYGVVNENQEKNLFVIHNNGNIIRFNSSSSEVINLKPSEADKEYLKKADYHETTAEDLGLEKDEATEIVYPTYRGVRSSKGISIPTGSGSTTVGIQSVSNSLDGKKLKTTVVGGDGIAKTSVPLELPSGTDIKSIVNAVKNNNITTTITDTDGNIVSSEPVALPQYILEAANASTIGGFKADAKTDADNIPVKIDPVTHKAFVAPVNKITITENGDGTVNIDVS